MLHWGSDDILAQDSEALVAKARAAGVELQHRRLDRLWHDIHLFAATVPAAAEAAADLGRAIRARLGGGPDPRSPRVAIVGAGMSGLAMGSALRHAGFEDFTIHEKAAEVGRSCASTPARDRRDRHPGEDLKRGSADGES